MNYTVSQAALDTRFTEWKSAMLLDIYHSLSLEFDVSLALDYDITNVTRYNLLISGMSGLLHTRYRGEAKYHSNPCLPIIARDPLNVSGSNDEITEINKFKQSEIGKQYAPDLTDRDITWWMLAQHYEGYQTRLLDITRNPLIALFFACEKYPDHDGYVYVFHSTNKTSIPLNPNYTGYQEHIFDLDSYYPDNTFVYLRPNFALDRINRQEAEFLWMRNYNHLRERGMYETEQIIPILIKKEYKAKILEELNDPQGINWNFLTPKKIREQL